MTDSGTSLLLSGRLHADAESAVAALFAAGCV